MNITRNFVDIIESRLSNFVPLIQIIIGPRQVGKSTAIKNFLSKHPEKSIYLQLDVPGLGITAEQKIRSAWSDARKIKGHKILVFDEIQNVKNWAAIVKELYDQDRSKGELSVALLGSSALSLLIQGEESLQGRFEIIRAYHWNYYESKKAFDWKLENFLQFGGYPIIGEIFSDSSEVILDRCQLFVRDAIIEPVISKDILTLGNVSNASLLRQLLQLILTIPCTDISFTKLLGQLQDRGNSATIKSYLELLEKSFLIKLLYRYSGSQLKLRTSSPKIIPLSPALIHAFVSPSRIQKDPAWFGRVFESAIISRLSEIGYEAFFWSNSKEDVDLVLKKNDEVIALEIKSNNILDWRGLTAFKKVFPEAKILAINFTKGEQILLAKDPKGLIMNWID